MRTRQQLLRALIVDIMADVDEAARDVILTIHWRGGQHSQLRVRKPKTGEHGCRTPDEALAVIRSMATRWSDEHIAASLNRILAAEQVVPDTPYQIRARDLQNQSVVDALARKARPCRTKMENQPSMFSDT
jgi:hypothetical protein